MGKERNIIIPASYLVLIKDNKVLLLRRYNTGYEDWNYSMVAGHVERWESFVGCIVREAKEEAWIVIKEEHLEVAHVLHRNWWNWDERIDIFFTAREWEWEVINMEPSKCDDLCWFDMDCIPDNIIAYIRDVIEYVKSGKFYSEAGW